MHITEVKLKTANTIHNQVSIQILKKPCKIKNKTIFIQLTWMVMTECTKAIGKDLWNYVNKNIKTYSSIDFGKLLAALCVFPVLETKYI